MSGLSQTECRLAEENCQTCVLVLQIGGEGWLVPPGTCSIAMQVPVIPTSHFNLFPAPGHRTIGRFLGWTMGNEAVELSEWLPLCGCE